MNSAFRTSRTSRWMADLKTAGESAPLTPHKALRLSWLVSWGQFYVISQRALLVVSPAVKYIIIFNNLNNVFYGRQSPDNKLLFFPPAFLSDGELYSGTAYNFLGSEPIISRYSPSQSLLRTEYSTSWLNGELGQRDKWSSILKIFRFVLHSYINILNSLSLSAVLAEPSFVFADVIREGTNRVDGEDDKIYYFFTEVSVEYEFFGKLLIPRVARVCKVSTRHAPSAHTSSIHL